MSMLREKKGLRMLVFTGAVIGLLSVLLTHLGNPANMGICVACFIRDTAGALGLHRAPVVQYIRPEVIGFLIGAFVLAVAKGEFKPTGGSSPIIRFFGGFFVMIGALVFLGCPLRMVLRLAGGDLNAIVGLIGFIAGIFVGGLFLKRGFSLGRAQTLPVSNGYIMPAVAAALLAFLLVRPAFIFFSEEGPGSMQAPIAVALIVGLIVGALSQRSRMCMAGGIRDVFLIKNATLLWGYVAVFVAALIANLVVGSFHLGFQGQPVAHTQGVWNFLGMFVVGLGSIIIGGCPLRQTIMAGEGNIDAAIAFLGLLVGGAFAHNFGLAASADGVPTNGRIAAIIGLVFFLLVGALNIRRKDA